MLQVQLSPNPEGEDAKERRSGATDGLSSGRCGGNSKCGVTDYALSFIKNSERIQTSSSMLSSTAFFEPSIYGRQEFAERGVNS